MSNRPKKRKKMVWALMGRTQMKGPRRDKKKNKMVWALVGRTQMKSPRRDRRWLGL